LLSGLVTDSTIIYTPVERSCNTLHFDIVNFKITKHKIVVTRFVKKNKKIVIPPRLYIQCMAIASNLAAPNQIYMDVK